MKIDAICKDAHGHERIVLVDTDYVDVADYADVVQWCENDINYPQTDFDIGTLEVANYDILLNEWTKEMESIECPVSSLLES